MGVHVELARERLEHAAVRVDHERSPLARQRSEALQAKLLRDTAIRIREERKAEPVLFIECFLPIHRIGADSHGLSAEFLELGREIAEMAALLRSAGGHRFRVEEQNEGPVLQQAGQRDLGALLIGGAEVRHHLWGTAEGEGLQQINSQISPGPRTIC